MTPYVVTIDGTEYTVTPTPAPKRPQFASVTFPPDTYGLWVVVFTEPLMASLWAGDESSNGRAARAYLQWFNAQDATS